MEAPVLGDIVIYTMVEGIEAPAIVMRTTKSVSIAPHSLTNPLHVDLAVCVWSPSTTAGTTSALNVPFGECGAVGTWHHKEVRP